MRYIPVFMAFEASVQSFAPTVLHTITKHFYNAISFCTCTRFWAQGNGVRFAFYCWLSGTLIYCLINSLGNVYGAILCVDLARLFKIIGTTLEFWVFYVIQFRYRYRPT